MDLLDQIWQFLTQPENGDRIAGIVFVFLVFFSILCSFVYYAFQLLFDFLNDLLKTLFAPFKRKEKIVEVPKYITPPQNKEIDKYLALLKKIVDEHNNAIKL